MVQSFPSLSRLLPSCRKQCSTRRRFWSWRTRALTRVWSPAFSRIYAVAKSHCLRMCCGYMKKTTKHLDVSSPQTVTGFIKVQDGKKAIKIGFTDQKISPHAGLSTFVSFLHWHRWKSELEKVLPQRTSPNGSPATD